MSGRARGHALEAAGGLLMTRAALQIVGFRRVKNAIEWLTPRKAESGGAATGAELDLAAAIERRVVSAARHVPFATNCLDRSLTLWWMLRRRGIAVELRIGGRKHDGRFEAHAWVEMGNAILDAGGDTGNFKKFEGPIAAMETPAS